MKIFQSTRSLILVSSLAVAGLAIWLSFVFSGQIILQQYFLIAGFKVHYYGLIIAAAVFSSYSYARARLTQINLTVDQFDSLVLVLLISGFIGARFYHVFSSFQYYWSHPIEVFYVWRGGLGIYGAIFLGLLALWLYSKRFLKTVSFLKLLDFLVPSIVIGQIIGRFGNLFNYEVYGLPTHVLWKMFVPLGFRIPPYETFQYFHPLFLYESLAGLLILILLVKWVDIANFLKWPIRNGQIFLIWLTLYSLVRFVIEFFRIEGSLLFGIRQNLIITGILILVGIGLFIRTIIHSNEFKNS